MRTVQTNIWYEACQLAGGLAGLAAGNGWLDPDETLPEALSYAGNGQRQRHGKTTLPMTLNEPYLLSDLSTDR